MDRTEDTGTNTDEPKRGLREIADLRPGDHLCVIYRDDDEHKTVLSDYLRRGLEAGERAMYIVDARTAPQIRGYLSSQGIDPHDAESRGQLVFLTGDDTYMRDGVFDPQGMISLLREETQKALDEGFSGLRVTGEMTWALRGLPGSERIIEYETLLNEFFPGSACIGLCQYDARRFPPEILLDVLHTHPIVIVGTRLYENIYYISPEELQAGKTDQSALDRWLLILEENQTLNDGLRERTRALKERIKELACLRQVRELTSCDDLSVTELLQAVLDPIRSGFRWPDRIGVRIEHGDSFYATEGFEDSRWRIATPILQHETQVGTLEVAYPDPPPEPDPFLPEERSLLHDLSVRLGHALASRYDVEKILHLNAVLRAVRSVNQLIIREHDADALIQQACNLLVEARGVMSAWIALLDERGRPARWAGACTPEEMEELISSWKNGDPPPCVQRALAADGLAVIEQRTSACPTCPMAVHYGPAVGLIMRLERKGYVHGVLVAAVPAALSSDPEELELWREMVDDCAYGLSAIATAKALQASETRYRRLFESAKDGILILDADTAQIVDVNPFMVALLGYSRETFLGKKLWEVGPFKDTLASKFSFAELQHRGYVRYEHLPLETADGRVIQVEFVSNVYHADGTKVIQCNIRDVSERHRAQAAQRESEDRYRRLVEDIDDVIFAVDRDGIVTYISPAVQALGGYAPDEITGRPFAQFIHADDQPLVAEAMQRALAGHQEPLESRVISKVGQVVWVRSLSKAFYGNGRPMGVRGVLSDISVVKKAAEELRESYAKVRRMLDDIVRVLTSTIELRDPYTAGHQRRVADLVAALGRELGLPPEEQSGLHIAGLVHDVGKVVVPAEILSKPGQLSKLEMDLVRAHPEAGFDVLRGIDFPWPVAEIVYQHHERLDGSGYPRGLKGDAVLFEARVLAVADVVEAMSSHRPYRPALGIEAALAEVEAGKGRLYDPQVVDACVRLFREGGFRLSDAAPALASRPRGG